MIQNILNKQEKQELEDCLEKELINQIKGAIDSKHAVLMLLEKGLIDKRELRNLSIVNDFFRLRKLPVLMIKDIIQMLSIKYNVSEMLIKKLVYDRKYY